MRTLRPERDLLAALNVRAFGPARPSPTSSSPALVTYRDTDRMANLGACWCGEQVDHDWPGRAEGKPHPRTA
jgi:hypothetical protein